VILERIWDMSIACFYFPNGFALRNDCEIINEDSESFSCVVYFGKEERFANVSTE